MRSFWFDPYLWIHVAGLAALPIFLELCLVALAVGDPLLPIWLEMLILASIGIAPVLWMQMSRPFYIFSILAVAISPAKLTEEQRRTLSLFKSPVSGVLAIAVAIVMGVVLWQIYRFSPIAASLVPSWVPEWRLVGLLLAGLAFLAANVFLQVPVSVARVLLTSETQFAATEPLSPEQIGQNFTIFGLQVNRILPTLASHRSAQATTLASPSGDEPASPSS